MTVAAEPNSISTEHLHCHRELCFTALLWRGRWGQGTSLSICLFLWTPGWVPSHTWRETDLVCFNFQISGARMALRVEWEDIWAGSPGGGLPLPCHHIFRPELSTTKQAFEEDTQQIRIWPGTELFWIHCLFHRNSLSISLSLCPELRSEHTKKYYNPVFEGYLMGMHWIFDSPYLCLEL